MTKAKSDEIRERQRAIHEWLRETLGNAIEIDDVDFPVVMYSLDGRSTSQQECIHAAIQSQASPPTDAPGKRRVAEPRSSGRMEIGGEGESEQEAEADDEPPSRLVGPGRVPENGRSRDAAERRPAPDEGVAERPKRGGFDVVGRARAREDQARSAATAAPEGDQPPPVEAPRPAAPAPSGPLIAFVPWPVVVEALKPAIGRSLQLTNETMYDIDHDSGALGIAFRLTRRPD